LASGPAASLIVPVFDVVHDHGLAVLAPIVVLSGVWQLIAGRLRLGQWFRAVAPAVIHGMLIGIGILIASSQLHVAIDGNPDSSFITNMVHFPGALIAGFRGAPASRGAAALVGLGTVAVLVGWNRFRPRALHLIPGHVI